MGTIRIFALCFLLVSPKPSASRAIAVTPIQFLLMVASDSSPDSSAVVPAVDQTLEEINRDTFILPGHHLEYILSDTSQVYYYPVRVCAAGLSVWFRPYVYLQEI